MRPVRSSLLALASLVVLTGAVLAGPAAGATTADTRPAAVAPCVYVPRCTPTLSVLSPTTAVGSQQVLAGSGFLPGDHVTVTITLADGTRLVLHAIADADGSFRLTFTVPDGLGNASIVAVGERSGSAGAVMDVVAALPSGSVAPTTTATATTTGGAGNGSDGGSDGGGLALTGVAVAGTGGLALLLVVAGVTLLVLGRRRRPDRHVPGHR